MNRTIRSVSMVCLMLFGVLYSYFAYLQIFKHEELMLDPNNDRRDKAVFLKPMGKVFTADGTLLAESKKSGSYYFRHYPQGELYGTLVGYNTRGFGASGLEARYMNELSGRTSSASSLQPDPYAANVTRPTNDVWLTLDHRLQKYAKDSLKGQSGAVVALDPRTGAILAMVSEPDIDPSVFSDPNDPSAGTNFDNYRTASRKPFINRAYAELFPPGSTFKVITAAAALDTGRIDPATEYVDTGKLELPDTDRSISNYGGRTYGRIDLTKAFSLSVNTAFAKIGLEIGAKELVTQARVFGFGSELIDEVPTAVSIIPNAGQMDAPSLAYSAIGQQSVRSSVLNMAVVAQTVAHHGVVNKPFLVSELRSDVRKVPVGRTERLTKGINRRTSEDLKKMMVETVEHGTGRNARIDRVSVAGKTGTAETVKGKPPHAWFIGFAPADDPKIAIAVLVENGGRLGDEATGGNLAAPIAGKVMAHYLDRARR